MNNLSPKSYWREHAGETPQFPPFSADAEADVAVIGAGITGLTTALHLQDAGLRVAVFEAGRVGAGTSGGTSGHLEIAPDQGWRRLVSDFGEDAAGRVIAFRRGAIDQIERWVERFEIKCKFQRIPARSFTEWGDNVAALREECEAARSLGVEAAFRQDPLLPFPTAAAIELPGQARFHILRYLNALAEALREGGTTIYEDSQADVEAGKPCKVKANEHHLRCDSVVLATHSNYLGISQFDLRQAPYQSYVVAVRVAEELEDALYWDDEQPYHYLRRAAADDPHLLLIGGADHKTGQGDPREHLEKLKNYIAGRFTVEEYLHEWSAEFFEPADGLPFIGRAPLMENVYFATGFSGTGLTYGTAAGRILADMILGKPANAEVFSPARIGPLTAAPNFVRENLNAAARMIGDRVGAESVDSLDVIAQGEGRVVRHDGELVAVYRDEQGALHVFQPTCTHAGCIVHWNNLEGTWDCPCHGGRFSPTGCRMYGPPAADLKPAELPHFEQSHG